MLDPRVPVIKNGKPTPKFEAFWREQMAPLAGLIAALKALEAAK